MGLQFENHAFHQSGQTLNPSEIDSVAQTNLVLAFQFWIAFLFLHTTKPEHPGQSFRIYMCNQRLNPRHRYQTANQRRQRHDWHPKPLSHHGT